MRSSFFSDLYVFLHRGKCRRTKFVQKIGIFQGFLSTDLRIWAKIASNFNCDFPFYPVGLSFFDQNDFAPKACFSGICMFSLTPSVYFSWGQKVFLKYTIGKYLRQDVVWFVFVVVHKRHSICFFRINSRSFRCVQFLGGIGNAKFPPTQDKAIVPGTEHLDQSQLLSCE